MCLEVEAGNESSDYDVEDEEVSQEYVERKYQRHITFVVVYRPHVLNISSIHCPEGRLFPVGQSLYFEEGDQ